MHFTAARLQIALVALALGAVGTMTSGAEARTYRVRVYPGLAQSADAPIVVAQNTVPAATEAPPGKVERPEGTARATASRSDAVEPPSERAAAAAARAQRALADEEGGQFEGSAPAQTELVTADDPVAPAPAAAEGQPVAAEQKRRNSASLQVPAQRAQAQPAATCIAGCY